MPDLSWILDYHWPEDDPRVGEGGRSPSGWTPAAGYWPMAYVPDMVPSAEDVAEAMMRQAEWHA